MVEPSQSAPGSVGASLQTIAKVLRDTSHLSPQQQATLAELVDELGKTVDSPSASSHEVAHLAESVAHLVRTIEEQHQESGPLATARHRLEQAITYAETKAPFLAGIAQRLLDALADLGI